MRLEKEVQSSDSDSIVVNKFIDYAHRYTSEVRWGLVRVYSLQCRMRLSTPIGHKVYPAEAGMVQRCVWNAFVCLAYDVGLRLNTGM